MESGLNPTTPLPLVLTGLHPVLVPPRAALPLARLGPGRTIHELYSSLGHSVEVYANRAAHRLGLGPNALASRIRDFFGDGDGRESKLNALAFCKFPSLEKYCVNLMQYARPSESSSTQLQAFRSITQLTTRYPRIRLLFLCCKDMQPLVPSEELLSDFWARSQDPCDRNWSFHHHFAAACISDGDISAMIEQPPFHRLGSVDSETDGLCVIERLLVASDCDFPSALPSDTWEEF
ncbi:hypothetical protein B0H10DRAFT_1027880 [Mycena sp. CBHHK59/15]|nr:hypothetical protein B0H10DRAFT_1027880 [Mycena sp. CBHHK59/15]